MGEKIVELGFVKSCSCWRRRIVVRIQGKLANDSGVMFFVYIDCWVE
jgi:hypothetical protein